MWGYVKGANRELFRLISLALMLALVLTGTGLRVAQADPGWYDAAWAYRKKITVDNTKVSAALTDFPVLISLSSDTDLASDAQNDGDDILFTASDGVAKLSHEIESFNGTSGQLVAWVKIPSLSSSTDTDIYMYYGHAGAGNQQNATFVWDSSYKMVQHLQETTGGINAIQDSTSNTNHGTDNNGPLLDQTGKIDGAIYFDGTDDFIDVAHHSSIDFDAGDSFTVAVWVKITDKGQSGTSNYQYFIDKRASGWGEGYQLYSEDNNYARFLITDDGGSVYLTDDVSLADGGWHYVVGVRDVSSDRLKLYLDGTEATDNVADTTTLTLFNNENLNLGRVKSDIGNREAKGLIDEVHISDTARSDDWIQVSYNNQQYPDKAVHGASGFFSLGSEDSGAPTAVGGVVYRVNKVNVLAPWLFLVLALSFAITRGAFQLRKSA